MYRYVLIATDLLPTSAPALRDRARADQPLEIVDGVVRQGRAPHEIAAVAAHRACDLIVIGTRARPDTLGSVAEQVVRIAAIAGRSVLVVPAEPPG